MVIWSHADGGYGYLFLLFGLFTAISLAMLFLYLRNFFLPAMKEPQNRRPFPAVLFSIPIVLVCVILILVLRMPLRLASYQKADKLILEGQVELVSYEEDWGRHFNGYAVVLNVDGTEFIPSDTFPEEMLERFAEGGQMRITYSVIEGEGNYVWQIESNP